MKNLYIFDPKKNKIVLAGYYSALHNYFLKLTTSNHFMVKEHSYGIQEEIIQQLREYNCDLIIIQTKTTRLQSKLNQWLTKGVVKDYGHGKQRFLNVKEMR